MRGRVECGIALSRRGGSLVVGVGQMHPHSPTLYPEKDLAEDVKCTKDDNIFFFSKHEPTKGSTKQVMISH